MPKIRLSDKQLPRIPTAEEREELNRLALMATPGPRKLEAIAQDGYGARHNMTTASGGPLGEADAQFAAACSPEMIRGLLYQIHLLEESAEYARDLALERSERD